MFPGCLLVTWLMCWLVESLGVWWPSLFYVIMWLMDCLFWFCLLVWWQHDMECFMAPSVGWLDGWLVGWLAGLSASWLVGSLPGWLTAWFVCCLFDEMTD